ncbi:acetoacetate--CoA ligase [Aquisalimonas sp.]|uniref:acetoacetate--CoA ligase n=1 Tax=Aquisalimonas sp. TaxID=1872621 RepID=UPI0025C49FDE|nr:acetoacetate--CoA ligase [Aquisalimonas sp.]
MIEEGSLLWEPSAKRIESANVTQLMRWLQHTRGLEFTDYHDLWRWSTEHLEDFWAAAWEYFEFKASPYQQVLTTREMPGAQWFTGSTLNWAEHALRHGAGDTPALFHCSEIRETTAVVTWRELEAQVAAAAEGLRQLGVQPGDRVVAYMPNIPETIVAVLATASLGAIWSSCSPDFGTPSVVDRFSQIEPKVLLAVDGYRYNGKAFDRMGVLRHLQDTLPTVDHTVLLPYLDGTADPGRLKATETWEAFLARGKGASLNFQQVPFDHPLWVLYSSGTTGMPKAIVHGHGGITVQHTLAGHVHSNVAPGDRCFWFTTTGWMMWNALTGMLVNGAALVLYDGNPAYPDMDRLWRLCEEAKITQMGISAAFLTACMKADRQPRKHHNLDHIRGIGATGSPLPPEAFRWVYDAVNPDVHLASSSGGTDICAGFVGGVPTLPVRAGEIQARLLGASVESWDDTGNALIDEVGEMVITRPMPSMPLFFWGDTDGSRYRDSYFDMFPGVWRHGDFIKITSRGSCIIYGRSDSTLNRYGVRMGTAEIYRVVEDLDAVVDSLVVNVERGEGQLYMPLFVVLAEGVTLDEALDRQIREKVRKDLSPRHVPDAIVPVTGVPRTLSGKKMEVPVKKLLLGYPEEKAVSRDACANPETINEYVRFGNELAR